MMSRIMSRWMGALRANGLRRLNQVSEREYGRAKVSESRTYTLDVKCIVV
ncbi:hypothetical protein Hdeb2414_s0010g00345601 [Helianthus debilis subsp. tardiflorus]